MERIRTPALLVFAILVASGLAQAQDRLARVREAIEARDFAAAEDALSAVLRSGEGGDNLAGTISEGLQLLRDAGATEGALRALDAAVSGRPADSLLLYHRGLVRRDLKFLAGARMDLRKALASDPGADPLEGELAVVEAFDFNHEAAATLFRDAKLLDAAAFELRLARSHDSAETRQWVALILSAALMAVPWLVLRGRRSRPR